MRISGADGCSCAEVDLAPGAMSHWHRHTGGQMLTVRAGRVRAQTDDRDVVVGPGTVVWSPAGERHRHGADGGTASWVTMSFGETEWEEQA
jgi:quercetin dioxygenase-like cupin family protein